LPEYPIVFPAADASNVPTGVDPPKSTPPIVSDEPEVFIQVLVASAPVKSPLKVIAPLFVTTTPDAIVVDPELLVSNADAAILKEELIFKALFPNVPEPSNVWELPESEIVVVPTLLIMPSTVRSPCTISGCTPDPENVPPAEMVKALVEAETFSVTVCPERIITLSGYEGMQEHVHVFGLFQLALLPVDATNT
jgi:hypothetical protein